MAVRPHASLIAEDLTAFLHSRLATFDSPIYGISLFVGYGYLGVGIATEAEFAHRSANSDLPEQWLQAPARLRWNTGSWGVVAEDFLTEPTRRALKRRLQASSEGGAIRGALAISGLRRTCARAIQRLEHIPELPASPHLIIFVEEDDSSTARTALHMLATVPPDTMRATFPHWARLRALVADARRDAEYMAELRNRVAAGERQFPKYLDPAPDELTAALRNCGLRWRDLTSDSADLRTALRVGAAIGVRP